MWFPHGSINHEVALTMINKFFDEIRWVTTGINRAGRAEFNHMFPAVYIMLLMAKAVGKCFWLRVMSLTKWPRFFADACDGRDG